MITIEKLQHKIATLSEQIEALTQTREDYLSTVHNIEMEVTRLVGAIKVLDSLIKENQDEAANDARSECNPDIAENNAGTDFTAYKIKDSDNNS